MILKKNKKILAYVGNFFNFGKFLLGEKKLVSTGESINIEV
jgi:hypothetical protein